MTQDEFAKAALKRVPVAETLLAVLANLLTKERLDSIYDAHRGRCYESELSFQTLVVLLTSAVLEHHASGRQAFRSARDNDLVSVTDQAVYRKLGRMPKSVSQALVGELAAPTKELFPESVTTRVPRCFNANNIYGIDGKKIKDVAKRLLETRGTPGKLMGGKTVVALSVHEGIVVAFHSTLDGEANDGPLVPGLLEEVHRQTPKDNVFLMDSQFCDLTTPNRILAYGSHFVARYHPKTKFYQDTTVKPQKGIDSLGRNYEEEIGFLGTPGTKTSIRVRRIRVFRDGKEDLLIVTSLLDWNGYSASDVLDLYGLRWTIETVFLHMTKEFDLRLLIGSTAEATVFQFSLTLILYNVSVLIQQHASQNQDIPPQEISIPKIVRICKKQLIAIGTIVPSKAIAQAIQADDVSLSGIKRLLNKCWDDDWKKAPKNKRNYAPPPKKKSGAHTSVFRQIQKYHEL